MGFFGLAFDRSIDIRPRGEGLEICRALAQQALIALRLMRIAEDAKEAAIAREREKAAEERSAELQRAVQALHRTIESLAEDTDLSSFVGGVLTVAAEQLAAPVVEYWRHDGDGLARLVMTCRDGRMVTGSDLPCDPRPGGVAIPACLNVVDTALTLRGHASSGDLANDPSPGAIYDAPGFDLKAWCAERGVTKLLNVQLRFGERSLGSLCVYFPADRELSTSRVELASALANQITLAVRLTELSGYAQAAALARQRAQVAHELHDTLAGAFTGILAAEFPLDDSFRGRAAERLVPRIDEIVLGTAAAADGHAAANVERVRGPGADIVVDYKTQRFEDFAKGVDLVLDTVGGETRERSWSLIRKGGALGSLLPPPPDEAKARELGIQAFMVHGHPNIAEIMPEMTRRLEAGELAFPEVAGTYPLEEASTAHADFERSSPRGRLVLTC